MDWLQVLILGAVEGFTEFLPISSTAHLILVSKLLAIPETEFLKSFILAIQLGAILAVAILYRKTLMQSRAAQKRIIVAFIPTAIIGFILYKFVKGFLLENTSVILWALALGGIGLIIFEYLTKPENETSENNIESITYKQAILVGLAQAVAVIPGVSRAAATIIGGSLVGIKRKVIVEFSFLLAVPTMAAATGYDLLKSGSHFQTNEFGLLALGFIFSFLFALIGVKFFIKIIQKRSFLYFGIYRILLAAQFIFFPFS